MVLKRMVLWMFLAMAGTLAAQNQMDNLPIKSINGTAYHYYEVGAKETIYSISRKLNIPQSEIERLNPSVADGLKVGQTLYFPVTGDIEGQIHVVKNKETLYGISKQYGVTPEQLCEWNPSAQDGIRPGQRLIVSAPVSVASASVPAAELVPAGKKHVIAEGETLFSIARANNTTVDAILAANPGLDREHYSSGTVIVLPEPNGDEALVALVDTPRPAVVEVSKKETSEPTDTPSSEIPVSQVPVTGIPVVENKEIYIVKNKDTFYSIAREHGISMDALEAANPDVISLRKGMELVIPKTGETAGMPVEGEPVFEPVEEVAEVSNSMTIAVTLPFMLSNEEQSRQAQLYTEFYKGFLVAVDSMRNCGSAINILTFDSSDAGGITGILSNPQLAEANVIIASDNEGQLNTLADYGRTHDINILNLFVVKDEAYLTNPRLMQGNIPHHDMYIKAINGILKNLGSHTPVILTRNNGEKDKEEYVEMLKVELASRGIEYKEIFFDGTMSTSALDDLDINGQYAFIPNSGKQVELNRVLPAIIEFKEKSLNPDPVKVFGYPEWITFRGETLANMHKANTTVYSRFFTDPDDATVKSIEQKYIDWYGTPMANFMPRQGLFGFDAGMFVINWLRSGSATPVKWEGVQNGFEFEQVPIGGNVNSKLYFINYRPGGLIDKKSL